MEKAETEESCANKTNPIPLDPGEKADHKGDKTKVLLLINADYRGAMVRRRNWRTMRE